MNEPSRALPVGAPPVVPSKLAYQQISTHGFQPEDRAALWEHHNAEVLFELGVRSIDAQPFEAAERSLSLGQLTFARVATTPHILERTADHCDRSEADGVMLFFMMSGDGFFHHRNGTLMQRPGTVVAFDTNQPFLRGFSGKLNEFVLTVPRPVFERVAEVSVLREPIIRSFAERDAAGAELVRSAEAAGLVRLMRDGLAESGSVDRAASEADIIELLESLFSDGNRTTAAGRRRAAIAWMRRNLHDPSLTVASVADAIGVSERSLTRAFGEASGAVARTLLEVRLERARTILTGPAAPTVREVAQRCGFTSPAHFSRAFRAQYGAAPSELRARPRR